LKGELADPWPLVDSAFKSPKKFGDHVSRLIGPTLSAKWTGLAASRRGLLTLMSRFDLSASQATRLYQPSERGAGHIEVTDAQLQANPFLLYELDRLSKEPVSVGVIDRGMFPPEAIAAQYPLPEASAP